VNAKPASKGAGSIDYGVKLVITHGLFVEANSHNVVKELKYYKYKEDKDGNPVGGAYADTYNHTIDALRYAVVGLLGRKDDNLQVTRQDGYVLNYYAR
jgi:phage terminase large subunit